ncbi:MAG: galactokinase [Acidimicrobiales bacterium]
MTRGDELDELFDYRFGGWPDYVIESPGRVNLIGEHTDYNDGFASPMAIERSVLLAVRARDDDQVVMYSGSNPNSARFAISDGQRLHGWGLYPQAVLWAMAQDGLEVQGFDGLLTSNIPSGSGLASSAALELAVARAQVSLTNGEWDPTAMAMRCVRAENEWVGVACGVMDQLICATASAGEVSQLDCRDLSIEKMKLPDELTVLVLHTGTKRGLRDSEYNDRRSTCERAAKMLDVGSLRDATIEQIGSAGLDDATARRARHVVSENQRVLDWGSALARRDWDAAGRLMVESHRSLRDDYEVSGPALDAMVEVALRVDGVLGARLTGAGFAGAAVALVKSTQAQRAAASIDREFRIRYDSVPNIIPTRPAAGTRLL